MEATFHVWYMNEYVICIYIYTHIYMHIYTHIYIHIITSMHTMEYYSAIKEKEIMPFAAPWMD